MMFLSPMESYGRRMKTLVLRRPTLPAGFYGPSLLGTAACLLHAVALYAVPAFLIREVLRSVSGLGLRVALIVPLTLLAGFGLQAMGFIGHEGIHLSLHRNKTV